MKRVLLLLALPLAAGAADFDARVAAAKAAIATRAGYAYDLALVPAVHAATLKCVPPGRAPGDRGRSFTTVATVDAAGRVSAIQVRPSMPLSQCFARHFGALRLHRPPSGAAGGHPILIEVRDRF